MIQSGSSPKPESTLETCMEEGWVVYELVVKANYQTRSMTKTFPSNQ